MKDRRKTPTGMMGAKNSDRNREAAKIFTGIVLVFGLILRVAASLDAVNLPEGDPVAVAHSWAEKRALAIRAAPNMAVPANAGKFYVSESTGNDKRDGRTPLTAWKTIERLNYQRLEPGMFVLFERGGTYRGSVRTWPGVTYTAYGTGPKPRIYGSPENGAQPSKWERTDNPKVWAYAIGCDDVGTLVFDGGSSCATKVLLQTDRKTGRRFNKITGRPFNSYKDLDVDLHFWHDYYTNGTGKVYLCSEQNPALRFASIEFNVKTCGFRVQNCENVTIDNFDIRYVGVHGVSAGTCRGLRVTNCEFHWIGGSIQGEKLFGHDFPTRLGNGVEVYGGCDGFEVINCLFDQIYDAGVTHQKLRLTASDGSLDQRNVLYKGNVFRNCNYSVEYFLSGDLERNPSQMENVLVVDNIMLDSGFGFCEQRPDPKCAAHIKSWRGGNRNRAKDFFVRNNIVCRGKDMLIEAYGTVTNSVGGVSVPVFADNVIIGSQGQVFGNISSCNEKYRDYGPETQEMVNRHGSGNRCIMIDDVWDVNNRQGKDDKQRGLKHD